VPQLVFKTSTAWQPHARQVRLLCRSVSELPYTRQPLELPARYAHGPDSFPRGALHEYEWDESRVFPRTTRRYRVYVPAQYTESKPAALMAFQDAEWYLDLEGQARASVVFDNLIERNEMPVTIGVFVAPGEPGRRNAEYDAFGDAYATFLLTELSPPSRSATRSRTIPTSGRSAAAAAAGYAPSPSAGCDLTAFGVS
jgi:enterochelin esterase-like enzyme